ncbi:hypothetical protein C8R45DRAFT_921536 [Mycena sanguinolenta]|nr:hypothetical protein C8R45DRAFT_921536 [Mycena sanguinolenta]
MSELTLSQGHLFGALYEAILFGNSDASAIHCILRQRFVARYIISTILKHWIWLGKRFTLILRAYVIFEGQRSAVILPSISLAVTFGTWIALIIAYSQQTPGTILFPHNIAVLAVLSFVMSFVTNVVITVMICARIWIVMRRFRVTGISASFYKRFIAFTVESGLIYPVVLVVTGVFFLTNNNALAILSGSNTQVLGIVPILLTLQLRFKLSEHENQTFTQNSNISTLPTFNSNRYRSRSHSDGTELVGMPHPPRTVVNLTTTTNYSSESGGDSLGSQTKKAKVEV